MPIHLLHTLSGVLILLGFASKISLHFYLAKQYNPGITLYHIALFPFAYIQPYKGDVSENHLLLKRACNFSLLLIVIAFTVNIITGVLPILQ